MKTVVIRMNVLSQDANGANGYSVQLFFDDGQADWLTRPLATTTLPEDLSIANPPLDPVTHNPLDGLQIRDSFLKEGGASPKFELWGSYLHQLLLTGAVGQEWNRIHGLYPREAAGQSEGLRTILEIKSDTLRWLPWELLYEAPLPWFFDAANPFTRGTLNPNLPVRSFTWPIHALVVVGSAKKDPSVNAELELDGIQRAFIKSPVPIDWYVCCRPTKAKLSDLITKFKPQIFHFIGHGKVGAYSFLELTDEKAVAAPEEWTVNDISIDFLDWQPRLAFVNACRTSSAASQKNSWDIAQGFSKAGVPAVVGMQADIQGDAAAAFSGGFYESLLSGLPIDVSLAKARANVRNLPTITLRRRDWALATLFLQQLPERILEMQPPIDKQTTQKFNIDSKLKQTRDFVGRRTQRRKLWYGVDQIADRDDDFSGTCIVVGNKHIGKTALVQASLKVCALRNRRVTYVDIDDKSTKDVVQLLKIIRAGDPNASDILCAPLPTAPFADFDLKYGPLLAKPDAATTLAAENNLCEQLFTSYKAALIDIAATEPLIIALDHLSVEWKSFNEILVEKLLLPIAQGVVTNCRLILVCADDDFEKHLSNKLKDIARIVEVKPWTPKKYVPLAREICLYNGFDLSQVEPVITGLAALILADWGPENLRALVNNLNLTRA